MLRLRLDMSSAAVTRRLREVAEHADLHPERRLDGKIDLSPRGVCARLREASELAQLAECLERAGRAARSR
jgi:hypothetical protein